MPTRQRWHSVSRICSSTQQRCQGSQACCFWLWRIFSHQCLQKIFCIFSDTLKEKISKERTYIHAYPHTHTNSPYTLMHTHTHKHTYTHTNLLRALSYWLDWFFNLNINTIVVVLFPCVQAQQRRRDCWHARRRGDCA